MIFFCANNSDNRVAVKEGRTFGRDRQFYTLVVCCEIQIFISVGRRKKKKKNF